MKESDLQKEVLEIQKELKNTKKIVKGTKGPIYILLGLILALLLIIMIVPTYTIKIDPRPTSIPTLAILPNIETQHHNYTLTNYESYRYLYNPSTVKIQADLISTYSCSYSQVCYGKAIFYFVRDNFQYVNDPTSYEYVKTASESLYTQGGDCDDTSILLSNLLGAIGIRTRLIFVPQHVYVQAFIPDAHNKYKKDGWINLDPTCQYCKFGETARDYENKVIVEM